MKENKSQVHYGWWSAEESEWSLNNNKNGNVIRIKKVVPLDALLIFQLCLDDERWDYRSVGKKERERRRASWWEREIQLGSPTGVPISFRPLPFFSRPAFKRTLMLLLLLLLLHLLLEKFSTDGDWEARLFVDRSMSFSWAVSTWLSAHRRVSLTHTHTHILYIRETDTKDTEIDGFPRLRTFESLVCLPSDYTSISVIPTGSE